MWLPLKLFGAGRFRAALAEKHELAVLAARELAATPGLALVAPPALSPFAFQAVPRGADAAERNRATRELVRRVNEKNRVMITSAQMPPLSSQKRGDPTTPRVGEAEPRFVARICVLCFRTRERHARTCIEDLRAAVSR